MGEYPEPAYQDQFERELTDMDVRVRRGRNWAMERASS